jgi:hypothetical protein
MKYSRKPIALFLALTAFAFVQCSGDKKEAASDSATVEDATTHEHEADVATSEAGKPEFTVNEVFQQQIKALFNSYLALKEGFVATDAAKVQTEAKKASEALSKVDMKLVTEKAHTDWMAYQMELTALLEQIATETDIEKQREHFSNVSNAMYKVVKAYGLGGITAYYEFCPMAFNDKGAYWLSESEKIRNPYFGDKMLTCGSVEETLQ